ncbi:hypothetical protein SSP24_43460 [Streptomyces spinoverrucosus]|uniref:Uncharacterized protein n=1 Tax=Streptomyces spinoverrucosus TaxID=284043 RepID=A0A4Y3VLU4_9ACTN|nr:hypothetical protein [Streptomyces spinoverrucosus]GEC06691.1 hypothetical protein SSP24_43460 [Streptomyces spinoverrucosus]GHB56386.1 hypothetical protein GCM10010397_28260 [Streptomyces spinoverrucosus]
MQTIRAKRDASDADLRLALAGAATAVGGIGALLALIESDSPLRGPFTLFFLLAAPAVAIAAALDGLDPLGRAIVALAGAIVLDMLVAQGLLALHLWSVRGGIAAVTVLSALTLLLVLVRRSGGRTARRGGS